MLLVNIIVKGKGWLSVNHLLTIRGKWQNKKQTNQKIAKNTIPHSISDYKYLSNGNQICQQRKIPNIIRWSFKNKSR